MAVHEGAALGDARTVAVLVHGRGQNAAVMRDLARRLGRPEVAYLLPEGPRLPGGGRSWYGGRFDAPVAELEPELSAALDAIDAAVATAAAARPPAGVVLVGFSQGACLAAERVARRGAAPLVGLGILTGALIGARKRDDEVRPLAVDLDGLPVALVSSATDAWVGPDFVRAAAAALRAAGADTTLEITNEPEHRIDDVAVAAVARLLDHAQEAPR